MIEALNESALKYACQRVEDFALVNRNRSGNEKAESVNLWLEHLGLDESLKSELVIWLDRFLGPGWDGAVMVGLAVGLFVNQYTIDHMP